jgi:glycosyltransferase involved in cell wall biosynthesis
VAVRPLNIGVYGSRGIPSTYSGYETFLTVLLPELARRGHDVTVYCRRGAVPDDPTHEGVRKRFLPSLQTKELGTLTHGALSAVVARVRRHDVVFVVNPANALFCAFATSSGQSVVLNTDGQEWIRGKWGPMGKRFFKMSAARAGAVSTALVSDSVAMAAIYRDEFGSSSTVIPYCWTDLAVAGGESKLAELGVEPGQFSCIAGRLIPENNAVPVARAYLDSSVPWPLLVLGTANYDSPVQRELTTLAQQDDRLRLVGHVDDRSQFAALVRLAGLYLHAHSVGGINPSLVEAMGLGALILALSTPFNREALAGAGYYFNDFGILLTEQIERLATQPPSAGESHRRAALSRAASEFRLRDVADAVEQLLLVAAERPARSSLAIDTRWSAAVSPGVPNLGNGRIERSDIQDPTARDC